MIQFDRLTLSGFKSFVDKTDLTIAPGLTGIVGPNGCGKSNLVEALRWCMGENSAKRMRGGEMDDVIFNGTTARPARNFAEVVIALNNGRHTAPEPYASYDQIEISRRIEREQGSTYRINGRIARARDVSLLLADTMTGAHSPALVSQGKLTQIISAKPFDRRVILEESAGITGLHARRHEAELRLQAAENNLNRLQDSLGALENQLASLKRQSRQAEKYRTLSEEIKTLEIAIAAMDWVKLNQQDQACARDVTAIETTVTQALLAVTQLSQTLDAQSVDLPALRNQAAQAAARFQAVTIELKQLEVQERQAQSQIDDAEQQRLQAMADINHDQQVIVDGQALTQALSAEEQQIITEESQEGERLPTLTETQSTIAARLATQEKALEVQTRALIEGETKRQSLDTQIADLRARLAQNQERQVQTQNRLAGMATIIDDNAHILQRQIDDLEARLQTLTSDIAAHNITLKAAEESVTATRKTLQDQRDACTRLSAEQKTLTDFLSVDTSSAQPILETIQAESGFELALAQALGDTLFGSLDEQAPVVWRGRAGMPAPSFPTGVTPLDEKIKAPPALHAALGYIGYVLDRETGDGASNFLAPGQTIVSLDGYLWRWDGLFVKPSAKDKHALILEQKNRLASIITDLAAHTDAMAVARAAHELAEADFARARAAITATEGEQQSTQKALNVARQEWQKSIQARQHNVAEHARLSELLALITADLVEKQTTLDTLVSERAGMPDDDHTTLATAVANLRDTVAAAQVELRQATIAVERHQQDQARRQARLHGIADQRIALHNRTARAQEHLAELQARLKTTEQKIASLAAQPDALRDARHQLMSSASILETQKQSADDALQACENDVAASTKALKEAEANLAQTREQRAGLLARRQGLQERLQVLEQEIIANFAMNPLGLMQAANLDYEAAPEILATIDDKRARKDKAVSDRNNIGPVNLRADVEAQEITAQLGLAATERDDLLAAIAELRGAITTINHEARERLTAAFDTINAHFKDLFTRLFGGGQAHLQLIETDGDPLGAGLEIFAQPPGKTLQTISLLSGGEQSLTAAALIFAMFLTNPSPICVLDEIDAPLDDANVDRICNLLRHITDTCQTRFLVVTHHRLTMARMDRLFGVTMGEKGVSQLVSVDLQQQLDLLEAA